jgi:hypothetical protein
LRAAPSTGVTHREREGTWFPHTPHSGGVCLVFLISKKKKKKQQKKKKKKKKK